MSDSGLILDGHKLNWHFERVKQWLNGERIAPITVDCSLTTQCSYRCTYCYGKMQRINTDAPLEKHVIRRFLKDCSLIGVKAVSFVSDGESTCNPHVYDAILYGKQNGLDIALGTNGFMLKDERLFDILPALTYLRFNISAGTREKYSQIHGVKPEFFDKVCKTIKTAVNIKKQKGLDVTIGMQMVLMPEFKDQIIPLTLLGRSLGADYLVIKHCSDDEKGTLGVNYSKYNELIELLKEAESYSIDDYHVSAKWSKILSEGKCDYERCYGPPFIIQLSGSGLVAPCGMFFNDKYKRFHIGNIKEKSFKEIWESERYWEVMNYLASEKFNAKTDCGSLCLQHKVNEYLNDIKENRKNNDKPDDNTNIPPHINFI
jgi:MoaA/NifB/PqqE/SkfB family radical SAM enzyme